MAGGRRPKVGARRIDAAIDHFVPMGFKKVDVRNIINRLLKKVYGNDGWPFLEENCYHVVQEALLEKQQEEEKLQLQILQKKQQQQQQQEEEEEEQQQNGDEEEAQHVQEQEEEEWFDDDDDQQQEAAMMGAPAENDMPIVQVHNEVPSETRLKVEQTEEVVPMIIDPPAPRAALPNPTATRSGRTRRPCYGWISESESDSDYEEFVASRKQLVHVPGPGGDLGKRKRQSRWDVKN